MPCKFQSKKWRKTNNIKVKFSINFFIEGRICDLLIKKGSYENMESPEILNKQELKHQQKLSCLNKGDEIRVSRGCYSILCEEVDI